MTLADIQEAAARIRPIAKRTPVMTSRSFDKVSDVSCYFKCEMFQKGGAFKIRGASNFLLSLPERERPNGVVAFSSGNHAQAVAIAAEYLGMPASIVMPHDAPLVKVDATASHGPRILRYDRHSEDREAIGRAIASQTGAALVPPFDHPWIIAGQGTTALELLEEAPHVDALAVCLGGGGLLGGCTIAAKAMRPAIRIFGVEPQAGNDYFLSLEKGEPVEIKPPDTIADGLRTTRPGVHTFPIIRALVERVLLVSDDEIRHSMEFIRTRMKLVVEPSGAVGAAAVLCGKLPKEIRSAAIVFSGGNC